MDPSPATSPQLGCGYLIFSKEVKEMQIMVTEAGFDAVSNPSLLGKNEA